MFFKLFLLFTLGPLIELYLLIKLGGLIGALNTIILIFLTGLVGAAMAQSQGLSVLFKIQRATEAGRMPVEELVDGAFVLIGGFLLITPGLITDVAGLMCLIPATRRFFKIFIKRYLQKKVRQADYRIHIDLK